MNYRKFGKLDWKVSALGFGAMRLPLTDNDMAHVDVPEAIKIIRYAIDHGVNYIDSAYGYHQGNSEKTVGLALRDGYRAKVRVATKLPVTQIKTPDEIDCIFHEQLERLQTDKIDFYLMHGLNGVNWPKVKNFNILRWAEGQMAAGRIGNLGFSFHDEFSVFKEILGSYDNWTLCQIQYNYMDVDNQAGRRGVEYAAGKGLAIVVMEPVRGGVLAKQPPEAVRRAWGRVLESSSLAESALRWVWNQPEISLALSGMSKMEQVVENVRTAGRFGPSSLNAGEIATFDRVREAYRNLNPVPCTGCNYCQPCPNGVAIPRIFNIFNETTVYQEPRLGFMRYASTAPIALKPEQRADNCLECNKCIEVCPQKIHIPSWLKKAHEKLTPKEPLPRM